MYSKRDIKSLFAKSSFMLQSFRHLTNDSFLATAKKGMTVMPEKCTQKEIDALSRIHHTIYFKMLHSSFEDAFPKLKVLTPLEMGILQVISENPGALLHEIAEKLAGSKSPLTSAVDWLERRGFVFRIISKRNRRSFELVFTDDGKTSQRQYIESEQAVYQKVADTLDTPEEVAELISLLEKVALRF